MRLPRIKFDCLNINNIKKFSLNLNKNGSYYHEKVVATVYINTKAMFSPAAAVTSEVAGLQYQILYNTYNCKYVTVATRLTTAYIFRHTIPFGHSYNIVYINTIYSVFLLKFK